jgi:hypothetical protein
LIFILVARVPLTSSYSSMASDSDGTAYKKNQSLTLAAASHLSESSGGDTPAPVLMKRNADAVI